MQLAHGSRRESEGGDTISPRPPPLQKKKKRVPNTRWVCGGRCYMSPPRSSRRRNADPGIPSGRARRLPAPGGAAPAAASSRPAPRRAAPTALGEGGRRAERAGRAARAAGLGFPRAPAGLRWGGGSSGPPPPSPPPAPAPPASPPPPPPAPLLTSREPASARVPGRPPAPGARSPARGAPGEGRCAGLRRRRAGGRPSLQPPSASARALRLERGRGSAGARAREPSAGCEGGEPGVHGLPEALSPPPGGPSEHEDGRLQRPQIPQTRLRGSPFCLGPFSALSFLSPPCGMLSSHQRD